MGVPRWLCTSTVAVGTRETPVHDVVNARPRVQRAFKKPSTLAGSSAAPRTRAATRVLLPESRLCLRALRVRDVIQSSRKITGKFAQLADSRARFPSDEASRNWKLIVRNLSHVGYADHSLGLDSSFSMESYDMYYMCSSWKAHVKLGIHIWVSVTWGEFQGGTINWKSDLTFLIRETMYILGNFESIFGVCRIIQMNFNL